MSVSSPAISAQARDGGLSSAERLAAFLAYASVETAGFVALEESFNYSAIGLPRAFPNRFTGVVQDYVGDPQRIANRAYANRLGNGDEASGDGWRYRGRGLTNLTGRANYAAASKEVGIDLLADPDRLSDPDVAVRQMLAFWRRIRGNDAADVGDMSKMYDQAIRLSDVQKAFSAYVTKLRSVWMNTLG